MRRLKSLHWVLSSGILISYGDGRKMLPTSYNNCLLFLFSQRPPKAERAPAFYTPSAAHAPKFIYAPFEHVRLRYEMRAIRPLPLLVFVPLATSKGFPLPSFIPPPPSSICPPQCNMTDVKFSYAPPHVKEIKQMPPGVIQFA